LRLRNPLKSEEAAFQLVLWAVTLAAVVIAITLIVRTLT
jgi:hypothetical protein